MLSRKQPGVQKSLTQFLDEETKTTALLVLRNDTILYERYFDRYDSTSMLPSFSVAKSFTSALVGIAVSEGAIASVQDTVTRYLPELAEEDSNWQSLTIEHLLNMRSGIKFNENNYTNPFSSVADLYFSHNIPKMLKRVKFSHPPGTHQYYSSLDTEILGLIVERATGIQLEEYLEQKIWQPLGMESSAEWSQDSKKHGTVKAFCCLHATARDYAKFGKLYLDGGMWEGKRVVPKSWVNKSILPDFSNDGYQYQWYSARKSYHSEKDSMGRGRTIIYPDSLSAQKAVTDSRYEMVKKSYSKPGWVVRTIGPDFFALGIYGQEIYVRPEEKVVFIRLGARWDTPTLQILYKVLQAIK